MQSDSLNSQFQFLKKCIYFKGFHCSSINACSLCTFGRSRDEKKNYVSHIYSGISLRHKQEGNIDICDNVDGPGGHYAE